MGAITTSQTFSTGDIITSTSMNNILGSSSIGADAIIGNTLSVASGKLSVRSGGITSSELATNAVTTTAILDANITPAKLSNSDFGAFTVASGVASLDTGVVAATNLATDSVETIKIKDANVTASKLSGSQTGTAPIFGVRAWVNFNGAISADIGGTYARTLTTVTVTTSVPHGLIVGHKVFLDFTSGTAVDGAFYVTTAPTSTTFTVTHGTSGTTSGNVTLSRRLINASGNVANVSYLTAGKYAVNFTTALPDANYARSGFSNFINTAIAGFVGTDSSGTTTAQSCDIFVGNSTNGVGLDTTVVNAIFVG